MYSLNPVDIGIWLHLGFYSVHALGKFRLCMDEVYFCQEQIGVENIVDMWSHFLGEFRENPDNLAPLFCLQFADAVVGFNHFGRFYEYRFAAGRLVVYNSFYLSLESWGDGNHQTAVADSGVHVFFHHTFALRCSQNAVKCA